KAPGEKTLDDLLKMDVGNGLSFADFYMDEVKENEVPLKDAWGNVFIYKYKGAEFWLASPGSDGEFKGFKQKGFYLFQPKVTDGMDIIFSNAGFTLFPTDREDLTRFILGPFVKVVTLLKLIFL
ncbi:MAG: hypothetical protein GY765_29040, partial [bacterium]|nr:hypothetical protein [bacterium]